MEAKQIETGDGAERPFEKVSENDIQTLSRDHPMSEFLKNNSGALKSMSEEDFTAAYAAQVKLSTLNDKKKLGSIGHSDKNSRSEAASNTGRESKENSSQASDSVNNFSAESSRGTSTPAPDTSITSGSGTGSGSSGLRESILNDSAATSSGAATLSSQDKLKSIVLKFTTLSEANTEAPSFTITEKGASVGRGSSNGVSVPSDARLALEGHAMIDNRDDRFYLTDGNHECAASLRIGMGVHSHRRWKLYVNSRFSAGNSIFQSNGLNAEGELLLEIIDGPLKGETRVITKEGATIGRSSDNKIAVPDRELSRRHSKIEYDASTHAFYVNDVGSTNGTYIQLVGPYGGSYRLNINDHILVGRTGFSVNRFDYGISEEIGHRQTMEDACAIVQHLNIASLSTNIKGGAGGVGGGGAGAGAGTVLFPQSFFGVFDGHGGAECSAFLSRNLHVNVANSIEEIAPALISLIAEEDACKSNVTRLAAQDSTNRLVMETIKRAFTTTDETFLKTSEFPEHGSTATTALLLGDKLYCSNTGDSRTMLCRRFSAVPLTTDHKPTREDEAARIKAAGGFIIGGRVVGELAVSRAFGDAGFKMGIQSIIGEETSVAGAAPDQQDNSDDMPATNWDQPLIIAEPDIEVVTIRPDDQFLLLACDGLFDVFSYDEIVAFVRDNMSKHGDAQRCCQNLSNEAIRVRNSRDNVSVILVVLNKWY
jgi:serine/threonine protein phosphatase PrpC